jgi:penicillin-binding protein 1C
VPAVDLLDRVGRARFAARLANAGLTLQLPRGSEPNLAMILGGTGATLEDLVGAYSALNRRGIAARVRLRRDDALDERHLLSEGAAWIVRDMLEANPRPGYNAETFDPGTHPRLAWKTGTSFGFRDAWAIGSTRRYTVGVWVGRPDGTPVPGQYGAVTALPLLFQAVDSLPRTPADAAPVPPPASVSQVDICWPLGAAFDPQKPELCHDKRSAWVLDGAVPLTFPERDTASWSAGTLHLRLDAKSQLRLSAGCGAKGDVREVDIARWPALAQPWLSPDARRRSRLPGLKPGCADDGLDATQPLRIDGIAEGSTLTRAPGSDKPAQVSLRALGAHGRVLWLVNGRVEGETENARPFQHAFAQTGEQTITALGSGGNYAQIEVRVLR